MCPPRAGAQRRAGACGAGGEKQVKALSGSWELGRWVPGRSHGAHPGKRQHPRPSLTPPGLRHLITGAQSDPWKPEPPFSAQSSGRVRITAAAAAAVSPSVLSNSGFG